MILNPSLKACSPYWPTMYVENSDKLQEVMLIISSLESAEALAAGVVGVDSYSASSSLSSDCFVKFVCWVVACCLWWPIADETEL
jgi:hypothetical protein